MIELSTRNYIYIYTGLVVISVIYLYYYRKNLLKHATEQTKRNQAIEKFQSYTRAVNDNIINTRIIRDGKEWRQNW
jgi:uncharacterized membrane protein